jgi:uncharacterized protein with HEPN domain
LKPADRDPLLYLEDVLESMRRIAEYIFELSFEDFKNDYKTVDAVVRNFEIIGEASKNLPTSIKVQYTNIPWEEMYRLRNLISHEYFGIDYEILWNIATVQLPKNREDVQRIFVELKRK